MRKAALYFVVSVVAVVPLIVSCTSRRGPSAVSSSQPTPANSQPCNRQPSGPEQQALVEKIKAMSEAEKIATITNYIDTQITQAKPGGYTAALIPRGSKASTIEKTLDAFRQLRLAQMTDFLVDTGRKKAEVDELTDEGVISMFQTAMKEKGCT